MNAGRPAIGVLLSRGLQRGFREGEAEIGRRGCRRGGERADRRQNTGRDHQRAIAAGRGGQPEPALPGIGAGAGRGAVLAPHPGPRQQLPHPRHRSLLDRAVEPVAAQHRIAARRLERGQQHVGLMGVRALEVEQQRALGKGRQHFGQFPDLTHALAPEREGPAAIGGIAIAGIERGELA